MITALHWERGYVLCTSRSAQEKPAKLRLRLRELLRDLLKAGRWTNEEGYNRLVFKLPARCPSRYHAAAHLQILA